MKTLGFLSMRFEENEKRDFRPSFFRGLTSLENRLVLEKNFGAKLGYGEQDYLDANGKISFGERDEVMAADVVVSVRTPGFDDLKKLRPGAVFFSMLHYLTRARRNEFLTQKQIRLVSMDSVVDDFGIRLIHDFPGSVENAFDAGYQEIFRNRCPELLRVLILGSGEIGKLATDTAILKSKVPAIVSVVGVSVTKNAKVMDELLAETDVLVDASKRVKTHEHIVSNEQLGLLPQDALIIDLSADDYDVNVTPIQVKGIEGIPTGNLDQYVFYTNDPAYDKVPGQLKTQNRRTLVSCNAWPGVDPIRCLNRYELQLDPFVRLLACESTDPSLNSENPYERALARATFTHFQLLQVK